MLVLTLDDDICWRGHANTGTGGPANVLSLNVKRLFFGGICEAKNCQMPRKCLRKEFIQTIKERPNEWNFSPLC